MCVQMLTEKHAEECSCFWQRMARAPQRDHGQPRVWGLHLFWSGRMSGPNWNCTFKRTLPPGPWISVDLPLLLLTATEQVHPAVSNYLFLIRINQAVHFAFCYLKHINLNIRCIYLRTHILNCYLNQHLFVFMNEGGIMTNSVFCPLTPPTKGKQY